MSITEKKLKEYLMLYGTETKNWPEAIQADVLRAKHNPALSGLIIKQQYFDEVLWNNRVIEPASADLANRIIVAARAVAKSSGISITAWIQELLAFVLPQPAFALATVLTLGIVIGFSLPALPPPVDDNNIITQAYFESDGAML